MTHQSDLRLYLALELMTYRSLDSRVSYLFAAIRTFYPVANLLRFRGNEQND